MQEEFYYENSIKKNIIFCFEYKRNRKLHIEEIDISDMSVLGKYKARPDLR